MYVWLLMDGLLTRVTSGTNGVLSEQNNGRGRSVSRGDSILTAIGLFGDVYSDF